MRWVSVVFLLLAALPARADMFQNAGNAKLPEARANLGINSPETNAALKAITGNKSLQATRLGFSAAGDGGYAIYNWSASNCTAADDGAQVQPTATGCWVADFGGKPAPVAVWGAQCDGATDDSAAFNAAAAAYSQILLPPGKDCKVTSSINLTRFPFLLQGQQGWPDYVGTPTRILCATGSDPCIRTDDTATQKPGITMTGIVFDGSAMTGGEVLHLTNTTDSRFTAITMNNIWGGVKITGPLDNNNSFDALRIQGCRGSDAVLWQNADSGTFSNLLKIRDSEIACGSGTNGIVLDGNVQTLHLTNVIIINAGVELWMKNTLGAGTCPGYIFANDVEFNGGTSAVNFFRADCGFSIQLVNGWSYGATSGDGFMFNHSATAPGTNNLQISNSQLFGTSATRLMFVDWNQVMISNTLLGGSAGDAFKTGSNGQRISMIGGQISDASAGYCVATTAGQDPRSVRLTGVSIPGGCVAGIYNDAGSALSLMAISAGQPEMGAINNITGCGAGCTVAMYNGNQLNGTMLMTAGPGASATGNFRINFTVPLTPYAVCSFMPRQGSTGTWNGLSTARTGALVSGDVQIQVDWDNNAAALIDTAAYFIDFTCNGL